MHQKVEALLRRITRKHIIIGAAAAAVFAVGLVGANLGAAAAEPVMNAGWVLTVDGCAVAGGATEAELSQAYEALVASYQQEGTLSTQVLNQVEIAEGEYSVALPQGENIAAALAEAITVRTEYREEKVEVITLNTVFIKDDNMYLDEYDFQPGNDGEQVTETTVICLNGQEFLRKQAPTQVTVEAAAPVLTMGTQERPEFIWPAHGAYTGSYGIDTINGANRVHKGIDIAAGQGTDILAARAGTVVYAGWDGGGFGNLVIIEHDNGTHTYYAHNSSILVSVGDFVQQGQHIAEMGSTGRVTGCHCHFEIRSGSYVGKYVSPTINPMNYLSLSDL